MGMLRLLLAISVVIAHTDSLFGMKLIGGELAVKIFFIISGFYMSLVLDGKYSGRNNYWLFIKNRCLRLFPMYWFVLLLTFMLSIVSYYILGDWGKLSQYAIYFEVMDFSTVLFLMLSNILLLGQDVVLF
jgi:peptidoglycan/LPS O-acetylase OafA/YrhL